MEKGQAEIAWREVMKLAFQVLETLAGRRLPIHPTLPVSGSNTHPTEEVVAFLHQWAAVLDGAVALGTDDQPPHPGRSLPIIGGVPTTQKADPSLMGYPDLTGDDGAAPVPQNGEST